MTPDTQHDPTDEFLFRYLADLCTPAERLELEAWAGQGAHHAARIERLRRLWRASPAAPAPDVDRMWTHLHAATREIAAAELQGLHAPERLPLAVAAAGVWRGHSRAWRVGAGAAAILALVGGVVVYLPRSHGTAATRHAATPTVYATGAAQTTHIQLRDGSRVVLAPMSRLSVPDDFGRRERTVTLEGQGFFDVEHRAALPFRVRARGTVAQDVGTQFDVRAYPEDTSVVVIVAEGAVSVGRATGGRATPAGEAVVVRGGERARLRDGDRVTTIDHVSLRVLDWTTGRLSFVQAPLAEIARTIGRWYGLEVRVSDPMLAGRRITADFDTRSAAEMVTTLATAVGATVERDGDVLTIRAKR
jgi:transmembrane sensor